VEPPIEVVYLESIHELPSILPKQAPYFTLLIACNASLLSDTEIVRSLGPLVERGLVYLCTWGEDCERVHDLADHIIVVNELEGVEEDYLVMTTWHKNDSLEKTTWYFKECALPSEHHVFDNFSCVAVAIGNKDWVDVIQRSLEKIADGRWEYDD
jgi:hypothetical protein